MRDFGERLPSGWASAQLGDVVEINPRFNPAEAGEPDVVSFVPMASVEAGSGRITTAVDRPWSDVRKGYTLFREGDVLFAKITPCMENGKVAVAKGLTKGLGAGSTEFYVLRPSDIIDAAFLLYFLLQEELRREARSKMRGNAGQLRVPKEFMETISVPIPPLPEQRRIVAEIETQFTRLDAAVAALERAQVNLKRYRAAVLETLVSGPWCTAPLSEVSVIQGGIQKQPKRAPVSNAYPFLRVANVHRGRLDLQDVHRVELFAGELEKLRLEAGDLLVVEGNGSQSEIGRMAIWDGSIQDCVHQNHLIRIRLNDELQPEYVEAYWNSPSGQRAVQSVTSSTSGLYTLSVRKIGQLTVPIPPRDRQIAVCQEIARQVSIVDELAITIDANWKRIERLRQSVLHKAFSGELVPQCPKDEPAISLLERIQADFATVPTLRKRAASTSRKPKKLEAQRALF